MSRRLTLLRLRLLALAERLVLDQRGSMAIEVAFLAPVLLVMSLGAFEVGSMVARQTELQSATAEAAAIVRAATPATADERTAIRDVLATSASLTTDKVSVVEIYRCNDSAAYVTNRDTCASGAVVNKFIRISIADTYQPLWTRYGVGSDMAFNVVRTIQVG